MLVLRQLGPNYIYLSMPPTEQNLTQGLFYSEDLGEVSNAGHRFAMPIIMKSPGDLADHSYARPDGLLQCESMPQNMYQVLNKACL